MSIKSVLVHVEASAADDARLDCASAVARAFDAQLVGVGAETYRVAVADPYFGFTPEWEAMVREQIVADLAIAERQFKAATVGLRTDWIALEGVPLDAVCRAARSADLIVAGGRLPTGGGSDFVADPARLALRSGRPVLVAPPTARAFRAERILVAWKDTREARRAIVDALPLLARAEVVRVMEVCDELDLEAAEFHTNEVKAFLRRHGIEASVAVEAARDDETCDRLCNAAQDLRADLVVAGCYGHNRLQEWVFGGVTRGLLKRPELFLLLSH